MSICKFCGKLIIGASSCIESRLVIDGQEYAPIPFRSNSSHPSQVRCTECNVLPGGYHHLGCSMEVCPRCGYHWVFCRCSGIKVKIEPAQLISKKVIPFPKQFIRKNLF